MLDTLSKEKKRRKRGKKLNLVGEEDTGAQLFHSSRVYAALEYQAVKEAAEQAKKAEKEAKKVQAAENKQRKEDKAQEKALQRQVNQEVKAQKKADKLAAKQVTKSQPKVIKEKGKKSLSVILPYKKASNSSTKVVTFAEHVEVIIKEKGSKIVKTRTCKIHLPQRFQSL